MCLEFDSGYLSGLVFVWYLIWFILVIEDKTASRTHTFDFIDAGAQRHGFQEVEGRAVHRADEARGDGRIVHRRVVTPAGRP